MEKLKGLGKYPPRKLRYTWSISEADMEPIEQPIEAPTWVAFMASASIAIFVVVGVLLYCVLFAVGMLKYLGE